MTTNVFCKKNNVLASDSRWSYRVDDRVSVTRAVAYIDNTGYDKMALDIDTGYMFAGPLEVIAKWREWALSPNQQILPRPAVAMDFAVCMTDLESGEIFMEHGQKVSDTFCRMAGTGAKPAYECWAVNYDARRAVVSASKTDVFSGGDVKFLMECGTSHNLDFSIPVTSIRDAFLKRGMVMYTADRNPIPVQEAAQNDPRIKSLLDGVQKGQISAEAPSGLDPVVWTPADEKRLDEALAARAARRAAR
jgi:hypothetical protein